MSADVFDWGLKEAVEIVEFLTNRDERADWGFSEAIDKAIDVVEAEQEAQRKKEAAERIRIETARKNAMTVRDKFIIPLLNDLRDDFAADEEQVLPQWHVRSCEDGDVFCAAATTADVGAAGATCFTIAAEASVAEDGAFVNLSVVCSAANPKDDSVGQLAPLVDKATKVPVEQKFDERGSRTWLYDQVAESARICVLTRMRQLAALAPPGDYSGRK
jgi:hypothetical protein